MSSHGKHCVKNEVPPTHAPLPHMPSLRRLNRNPYYSPPCISRKSTPVSSSCFMRLTHECEVHVRPFFQVVEVRWETWQHIVCQKQRELMVPRVSVPCLPRRSAVRRSIALIRYYCSLALHQQGFTKLIECARCGLKNSPNMLI